MAFGHERTEDGLEVWRLVVGKAEVPGRYVLRDRRFESLEPGEDG